jgi:hypothetical protein
MSARFTELLNWLAPLQCIIPLDQTPSACMHCLLHTHARSAMQPSAPTPSTCRPPPWAVQKLLCCLQYIQPSRTALLHGHASCSLPHGPYQPVVRLLFMLDTGLGKDSNALPCVCTGHCSNPCIHYTAYVHHSRLNHIPSKQHDAMAPTMRQAMNVWGCAQHS